MAMTFAPVRKPYPKPGAGAPEPVTDIMRARRHPLEAFFSPAAVAIVGATDKAGSVGRTVITNLISSPFGGTVYPVNPNRRNVLGIRAAPRISDVPEQVDLAVVVTPAPTVPDVIAECGAVHARAAIVITAGFKEAGPEGAALEARVVEEARRGGVRLIGPNCLGVMRPVSGLNATFAAAMARRGRVAMVSQSGALLTAILDWSLEASVGFSAIVSLGSMADVGWGDVITYLGDDPYTEAILLYMETVGDARTFLSAAREVALTKPIIVIKPGRTEQGARAASSHTGSLAGSDEVLGTAFRRVGVLRVGRIEDLFDMAEVLAKQPRPPGRRLTILTNAGGPGVIATDALVGGGGELAALSPETMTALDGLLPAAWSHGNPVDVLGDAQPDRYAAALEAVSHDPGSDGMLIILTPQAMTDPSGTAERVAGYARLGGGKPILASWMGGGDVEPGTAILNRAGIPTYSYPDAAAQSFNYLWGYADSLRSLYETPALPSGRASASRARRAGDVIRAAIESGRTLLTEVESKEVLGAYGVPITETRSAHTEADAVAAAEAIGYPVVIKLLSHTITHKTDVGGVQLNLPNARAVRAAWRSIRRAVTERRGAEHFQGVTVQPMIEWSGYELIVGSSFDPQFGPVLLFGAGGTLVEVFRDRALALPPLTTTLARRLIEQTRIYDALRGARGRPAVDLTTLESLLVRFSEFVVEHPRVREAEINPLLVSAERIAALDARVVLHDPATPDSALSRPAIRPYPSQYVGKWRARDGSRFLIRPIRPEDEPGVIDFHQMLSEESIYMRYFQNLGIDQRTAHDRLVRVCFTDYDRELALVAECRVSAHAGQPIIAAVGRLSREHAINEAEFSMIVADRFQRRGLGSELLRRLVDIGRAEGLDRITAEILATNLPMVRVASKAGFHLRHDPAEDVVEAEMILRP